MGPGRQHATACDAVEAASPGDVIEIFASETISSTCGWSKPGLTISGVDNPVISATAGVSVLEVFADGTVIQNLTIQGARCEGTSCAGIALHGRDLTLRNVTISGSNVGLKTDDGIVGAVSIESSEFADNDTNVDVGSIDRLRLTNSYLHDATADLMFTKAAANELSGNRFSSLESATTKRQLVLAGSKRSIITGNLFFKGGKATDTAMIQSLDTGEDAGEIQLFNNTLVNHFAPGAIFLEAIGENTPTVEARRNVIWGSGKVTTLNVRADLSENYTGIDPIFADENFRVLEGTVPAGWGAEFDMASVEFRSARDQAPATSHKGQLLAAGGPGPASITLNCGPSIAGVLYVFDNTVRLSAPAPAGGVVVTVTSSNSTVAPVVTPTVTIASGQTSGAFAFRTNLTSISTPITFTATANGISKTSDVVMVGPASLSDIELESPTIAGGFTTKMNKLTLTGPAPAEGITMTLSTTNPKAQVPATVFFPPGFTSQVFPITTSIVSSTYTGKVTAVHASGTRSAVLTVAPLSVSSLVNVTNPVMAGGSYSIIKVVLTGAAPAGGALVALASSNSTVAPVQSTIMIGAGATYAAFYILTRPVSSTTPVTITATLFGQAKTTVLTVSPVQLYILATLPGVVRSGATTALYTVLDNLAPSGGKTVTLTTSNSVLAPVPSQVVVPAGVQSTALSIKAGKVTSSTTVAIRATAGSVTKTTILTINP